MLRHDASILRDAQPVSLYTTICIYIYTAYVYAYTYITYQCRTLDIYNKKVKGKDTGQPETEDIVDTVMGRDIETVALTYGSTRAPRITSKLCRFYTSTLLYEIYKLLLKASEKWYATFDIVALRTRTRKRVDASASTRHQRHQRHLFVRREHLSTDNVSVSPTQTPSLQLILFILGTTYLLFSRVERSIIV